MLSFEAGDFGKGLCRLDFGMFSPSVSPKLQNYPSNAIGLGRLPTRAQPLFDVCSQSQVVPREVRTLSKCFRISLQSDSNSFLYVHAAGSKCLESASSQKLAMPHSLAISLHPMQHECLASATHQPQSIICGVHFFSQTRCKQFGARRAAERRERPSSAA